MKKINCFCLNLFFVFCFLLFISSASFASYISINTSVESVVKNNELIVTVFSQNKGDEPAYSVQSEIKVGDKTVMGGKKDQLEINAVWPTQARFNLKGLMPGQYPIIILQHYADANQYPFSAPVMRSFIYKADDRPADVFGKLSSATLWKEGDIELTLKNMSDTVVNVTTHLAIPKELSGSWTIWAQRLKPKSQETCKITINNFSALSGSSYQIYAIVEYDKGGFHQTIVVPGMVKIVRSNAFLGINYNTLVFVLFVLIIVFLLVQIFKNEKK